MQVSDRDTWIFAVRFFKKMGLDNARFDVQVAGPHVEAARSGQLSAGMPGYLKIHLLCHQP